MTSKICFGVSPLTTVTSPVWEGISRTGQHDWFYGSEEPAHLLVEGLLSG